MTNEQELRAKSLEIAVSILGSTNDSHLDKYLPLAREIARYINASPSDTPTGGSVGFAPVTGI
jgi:hypothetical protein